ncbi:hypothetical protein BST16_05270 [Mycobacterium asiaticum DSM 44297]|nr:hypothetical protein BST16_05270 [Mycobacterium asiaticum DSM 44297]
MAIVNYPHVEHIWPKSDFPHLVVAWSNLTLICEICNNTKLDFYSLASPLLNPYEDDPDDHLIYLGHLIMPAPGSDRGLLTVKYLGLSRQPLADQRYNRIKAVLSLVDSWKRASGTAVKDALFAMIVEDASNGPYQKTVLATLRQCGIDLDLNG